MGLKRAHKSSPAGGKKRSRHKIFADSVGGRAAKYVEWKKKPRTTNQRNKTQNPKKKTPTPLLGNGANSEQGGS